MTNLAYAVYTASALGFLMQLDALPPRWETVDADVFSRLAPGSSTWTRPDDLRQLQVPGFPRGFADLRARQRAALLRAAAMENGAEGGLQVAARAAELRRIRWESDDLLAAAARADWLARSCIL